MVDRKTSSANRTEAETVVNYEYDDKSATVINTVCGNASFTSHSGTDGFGRKTFDELQTGLGFITRQFTYHKGQVTAEHKANEKLKSGPVTQLVKRIDMSDGRILSYEYGNDERITGITESRDTAPGEIISRTEYTYDSLGQLLKEVRNGVIINEMTYDNLGNIKSKNGAPYTYGTGPWRDLLIGCCGSSITYDTQGNPIKYLGHTLVWEKGRQLKKYDNNTYTYNASGIRTGKNINGIKHTYRLEGTKILSEKWGNNTLIPLYDNEDGVCGIIYNGTAYYFLKNLQGDVISIKDAYNKSVAEYLYDAWGVCTVVSDSTAEKIADINPFRYRSYYYDAEIKMYYLQSRYYDPEVGRFINADKEIIETLFGINLFTYCINNPVNTIDLDGYVPRYISRQTDNFEIDGIKMKDIPFGTKGNISQEGCGVIAVYNVLVTYCPGLKFKGVNHELQILNNGILFKSGKLGLSPMVIKDYMAIYFRDFNITTKKKQWANMARSSEAMIMLVRWGGTIMLHYIAGVSASTNKVGNPFRFYNTNLKDRYKRSIDGKIMTIENLIDIMNDQKVVRLWFIGFRTKKEWL